MIKRNKRGRFVKGIVPLNKGKSMNKDFKRKCSAGWKKFRKEHPEYAAKQSRIRNAYIKKHPEFRKRISVISKRIMSNPAVRKKLDIKLTEFWRNHPNLRKQKSKSVKKYFLNHPIALKNLMEYSKKSFKPYLKTHQGFKVRSKGEQTIANYLFSNHIPAQYESKTLPFPEMICVPDFYLPRTHQYIEFYGGFPGAWKRKVAKNKLYKKYKVPCIFITPSELTNLKKALKK